MATLQTAPTGMVEPARGRRRLAVIATLQGNQLVVVAVAFLVSVFAARTLDPDGRGDLALWIQLAYLFATLGLIGLERPVAASAEAPFEAAVARMARASLPGCAILVLPVAGAAIAFAAGEHEWALAALTGTIFAFGSLATRIGRTAVIVSGQSRLFWILSTASAAALAAVAGFLSVTGHADPVAWLAAYAATSVPFLVLLAVAVARHTRSHSEAGAATSTLRRAGLLLLPASLANTAMLRSERLLIPLLASTAELGIYTMVATLTEMASWPAQNWADARLRSWRLEIEADGGVSRRPLLIAVAGTATLSLLCGLAAVGLIAWVLPASYAPALGMILPLSLASFVYGVSRIQQGILVARDRGGLASVASVVGMVGAVALYIATIPAFGAEGASWASLLAYCLSVAAGHLGERRVTRRNRPVGRHCA